MQMQVLNTINENGVDQDVVEDSQSRRAMEIGSAMDGVLTFKIQKQTLHAYSYKIRMGAMDILIHEL
jgi:hypothetical protein